MIVWTFAKETFDRLQTHLELKGLLPDEYFLFSDELTGELPEFDQALCIPNFGASEGIYLDISLACRDKDGKRCFQNFATGKTLGETADDYYRMFRIAAECSLMLNGRGNTYEQKKVDIVLTEQEAEAVGTVVDMELCGHHPPEAEAILNSALEKIDRIAFASAMPMCRTRRFSSGSLQRSNSKVLIFANFTPPYLVPVLPRRSVQMRFPALPYADGLNPPQNAPSAFPPGRY